MHFGGEHCLMAPQNRRRNLTAGITEMQMSHQKMLERRRKGSRSRTSYRLRTSQPNSTILPLTQIGAVEPTEVLSANDPVVCFARYNLSIAGVELVRKDTTFIAEFHRVQFRHPY